MTADRLTDHSCDECEFPHCDCGLPDGLCITCTDCQDDRREGVDAGDD